MRDFSPDLTDLRRRLEASRVYLGIDAARAGIVELEEEVSKPDLWDDQTLARKVTTELARNRADVELYDALDQQLLARPQGTGGPVHLIGDREADAADVLEQEADVPVEDDDPAL